MPETAYKLCKGCHVSKPLEEFHPAGPNARWRRGSCVKCVNAGRRAKARAASPKVKTLRPVDTYPAVDKSFGHWLAGFADGEGSFGISQPRKSYICKFHISLRLDDADILHECQHRLELGNVGLVKREKLRSPNEKPCARWEVGGKIPCLRLVQIFDEFPLRAKKRRDFEIWREAVIEWNALSPESGYPYDWTRMAELRTALNRCREYPVHPPAA